MFNGIVKKITSLENPIIKHLVRLRGNKDYRQREKGTLVSGETLLSELKENCLFKSIITCDESLVNKFDAPIIYLVTEAIMKKVLSLPAPLPIAAEIEIPEPSQLNQKKRLLACDRISDPGNLGTLVRTALSLGWEGIYLIDESTDLFNDRAIRASRGSTLVLPYSYGSLEDFTHFAHENDFEIFLADLEGKNINEVSMKKGILLLGNESRGLQRDAKSLGTSIRIPTTALMPSLNVAVAGAILMYALREGN